MSQGVRGSGERERDWAVASRVEQSEYTAFID